MIGGPVSSYTYLSVYENHQNHRTLICVKTQNYYQFELTLTLNKPGVSLCLEKVRQNQLMAE